MILQKSCCAVEQADGGEEDIAGRSGGGEGECVSKQGGGHGPRAHVVGVPRHVAVYPGEGGEQT